MKLLFENLAKLSTLRLRNILNEIHPRLSYSPSEHTACEIWAKEKKTKNGLGQIIEFDHHENLKAWLIGKILYVQAGSVD